MARGMLKIVSFKGHTMNQAENVPGCFHMPKGLPDGKVKFGKELSQSRWVVFSRILPSWLEDLLICSRSRKETNNWAPICSSDLGA